MDDSWFIELHIQPQSPSLPLGFWIEQHEHNPLHVNMLDEDEEEQEEEIPPPNQMEEVGDIATPLQTPLSNQKNVVLGTFVGKIFSDICDEVVAENEEHEPLQEALATEGERLGQKLAAKHAPIKSKLRIMMKNQCYKKLNMC